MGYRVKKRGKSVSYTHLALEAWENFVDNAWSNATEEESVMLPVKSMKFVANSQMDERR